MPDHIHIFVDCPVTVAPCDVVRTLKSMSAIQLFKAYPELKRFYARCGKLWSNGYFISSVGHISEAAVKKYIEEHKDDTTRIESLSQMFRQTCISIGDESDLCRKVSDFGNPQLDRVD